MENKKETNNFKELIKIAERGNPNHIVYKFKKNSESEEPEYIEITYNRFKEDIKCMSTALLNLGLENKRVALVGKNRYEWCISYLAATTGNMVIVPLDAALPNNELELLIERSEATAIIYEEKYSEVIRNIKNNKDTNLETLISMDETDKAEEIYFWDLVKKGKKLVKEGNSSYENIEVDPYKMSVMLFTSGTTNAPKAVMLSQSNICLNVEAIYNYVKLKPTDTLLSFLPMHHTFECTITFLFGLYNGATVAFSDGLRYIQKNIKEYKVSVFVAVPVILETMYKKIQKALEANIPIQAILGEDLRIVLYGAAPMNKDTIIGYNKLGIELIQGYGLTETSPVIACETTEQKNPGSVGLPLYNLEVKIDNPDKEGVGEILVKGPSVMIGYYKNEEETKNVLKDGWFYTGDYGYFDKDKFLYVTGRKKDVIVLRNGKNVYPQEIEFLINKIPYIMESLVYQREQDSTDTMLCAKIVYSEELIKEVLGTKTEEEYKEIIWKEIKEINKNLPIYKHIKKITITEKPLIKTTTQKVKRYEELKNINV